MLSLSMHSPSYHLQITVEETLSHGGGALGTDGRVSLGGNRGNN